MQMRPVLLSEHGCTKAKCKQTQEKEDAAAAEVSKLPASFPLLRQQNIPAKPIAPRKPGLKCDTCTAREVTACDITVTYLSHEAQSIQPFTKHTGGVCIPVAVRLLGDILQNMREMLDTDGKS
jgi:hypothetical protein